MQLTEQWKYGTIVATGGGWGTPDWYLCFGTFRKTGAQAKMDALEIEPTISLLREGKVLVEQIVNSGVSTDFCQTLSSMFCKPRVLAGVECGKPYVWLEFENISDAGYGRSYFEKLKIPIPLSEVELAITAINLASNRANNLKQQVQLIQSTLLPQNKLGDAAQTGFLLLGTLGLVFILANGCRAYFR